MNPFILLLKPMIAIGTFLTKLVVAAGMVAVDGRQAATDTAKVNTEVAIVRVAVSPEDRSLSSMEVELPNGEFYQLAGTGPDESAPTAMVALRPGGRMVARTHSSGSSTTVAMLESETGHSMRCNVSLPPDSAGGSGVCTTDSGKKYEFAFDL